MAEAIVSTVMDQLASLIRNEVEQEVRLVVGVREELNNLNAHLTLIKAVLEDAEKKEIHDNAIKVWLGQLKDVMYDAEDVLDEWNTRILISANGPHVANRVRSYLLSLCACFKHVGVRHDFAHRIKGIRDGLDVIALRKDQLGLVQSHSQEEEPRQFTSSVVDVSEVFGRDLDKQNILSRLLCETSQQETQVPTPILSIVGTGGFGKTTLAQLVYNEGTIATTFELKIWVCVSEPFDRERIVREIIAHATREKLPENVVGWDLLHQHLCNSVKGKRFLLVLDDVWTEDSGLWEPLKLSLNGGERGSKIIVTTRNEGVAKMIGSIYIHRLEQLSDDGGWDLFRHIAFWGRSEEDCERLKGIGQKLAKKCKGIPLAVKTLASLMRCKQSKEDWMGVLENDIWKTQEQTFLPALLLSYHALPSVLKRCFIYCAIFPKDHNMEKDKLVKLWMAQGYLGSDGARELERVGVEYFDALAMRSFFQDFKKDKDGNIFRCKMHDLVHDFAEFLTKADCSVLVNNEKICNDKIRHLTVDDVDNPFIYEAKKLRTLIGKASKSVPSALHQLTCLRTLDLSRAYGGAFEVLPSEVSRLLHLRYLDLSHNSDLKELPETVRSLVNLQTLKLNWCTSLRKLPEGIGELSNLRHLEVECTYFLKYYPRGGIERLSELRTLSKFVVSDGSSKGSVIGELGNLNFLKGRRLHITGLIHVKNGNEAKEAQLQKKENISDLVLNFGYDEISRYVKHVSREEEIRRMEGVLENLEPHKESLERLEIENYVGSTLPSTWMMSNITYLLLFCCPNLKVEPDYFFPLRLKTLVLSEEVGVLSKSLMSLTHNNNLKTLFICRSPHSSLPQGLNQLTSLQQLNFRLCNSLDFKPEELKPLTMLRKLEIYKCPIITRRERSREEDWSILTHIPKIEIDGEDIKRSRN